MVGFGAGFTAQTRYKKSWVCSSFFGRVSKYIYSELGERGFWMGLNAGHTVFTIGPDPGVVSVLFCLVEQGPTFFEPLRARVPPRSNGYRKSWTLFYSSPGNAERRRTVVLVPRTSRSDSGYVRIFTAEMNRKKSWTTGRLFFAFLNWSCSELGEQPYRPTWTKRPLSIFWKIIHPTTKSYGTSRP